MLAPTIILAVAAACVKADYRITGGKDASIEEFPHQVGIEYKGELGCGGAIIGQKLILTAAHCATAIEPEDARINLKIRVGSSFLEKGGVLYDVADYKNFTYMEGDQPFDGDIAVITLAKPITFGANAQAIAIVPEGMEPKPGEMLTATGWGVVTGSFYSPVLKSVRLPYIDRNTCNAVYPFEVTLNMFCAGGGLERSTLDVDLGGAIINDKKQLVGLSSWRAGLKYRPGYPAVFTNLARPAIQQFIRQHRYNRRIKVGSSSSEEKQTGL